MFVIYKAEFPNGKVYIGKSKDFNSRKIKHSYSTRYYNTKLTNAINKYGFDSIKWDIIFETEDPLLINTKEKEFIVKYDSIKNGYNISTGGDGGDTISNNYRRTEIIKQRLKSYGHNPENYIEISEIIGNLILDDYIKNKASIRELSRKYKISRQRLTRFLLKNNIQIDIDKAVEINSKTFDSEYIDKIINLYEMGLTIKEISRSENLTIMIVSRILNDSGIRPSKRFENGKRYDGRQPKNKK